MSIAQTHTFLFVTTINKIRDDSHCKGYLNKVALQEILLI